MAQLVYATAADFYDFIGGDQPMTTADPPVPVVEKDLNAKLRRASQTIEGVLTTAVYDTDDEGYPSDQNIADAIRDAVCAQADWWADTDDVTGAVSQDGPTRIGSVTLGGGQSQQSGRKSADEARRSPEAIDILKQAGLLSAIVAHR